jgi:hypothetical protein
MKTLLIIPLTVVAFSHVKAYNYPIGIPAAWIDPDAKQAPRPTSWESVVAGNYYVDNTHPQATDTNNTYGYPAKPRISIPTTYAAGSRVEVHGGPYSGSQLPMTFNGTEVSPCWFVGVDHPIIRMETILKGSYMIFDGFKFDTSRKCVSCRSHNGSNAHHAMIRNCLLEGPGSYDGATTCIGVSGTDGNRFHDIIVYSNTIHDFGDDEYKVNGVLTENDYHGMSCSQNADDIWFLENEVYSMGGDSIQIGKATISATSRVNRIFVGKNRFHKNLENAVDIKAANSVVISQNSCYDFLPANTLGGTAIVIHDNPTDVWCICNTVHSAGTGIITTGSSNTWFVGNLIYNIHHNPAAPWDPNSGYASGVAMHMRATTGGGGVNNTLYDYDIGVQLPTGGNPNGYLFKGNIFANRTNEGGDDVNASVSGVAALTTLDYNLYTDMAVNYAGNDYTSLSVLFMGKGQEQHGAENSQPHFKNPTDYDFSLGSDSPAVDAGPIMDPSALYIEFQARFGIDIRRDIHGATRPAGNAWDVGAYEYSAGISPPGPPKVEPLRGQ